MKDEYLNYTDWFDIEKNTDNIYIVDINSTTNSVIEVTEKFNRKELLEVNNFIDYSINQYSSMGSMTIYNITERAIDNRNNLILFVTQEFKRINKN